MNTTPTRPNLLIFRSALLAYSETFIPAQAEKLEHFTPHYAGLIPVDGYPLPPDRRLLATTSHKTGKVLDAAAIFGFYPPRFSRQIRDLAPRLIHAHFEESGIKAQELARRLGLPLVTTCHGYDVTVDAYRWRRYPGLAAYHRKRRRDYLRQGSLFLGVSRFICDQMLRRGYPRDKVRLHYIGVDTTLFTGPPSTQREPVVLFVGRLVEKKGCADLVRAMGRLRGALPDLELHVMGDGLLRTKLEQLASECGARVRFLGPQPVPSVRAALARCMMLCVPSTRSQSGDSEGLGMVFLEAMASGTPVVSTRHGGIPEVVEDGVTGLLCAERAPHELAAAIRRLAQEPALREKMGTAGRTRVLQHFDLAQQTRKLEQIYEELATRRRSTS